MGDRWRSAAGVAVSAAAVLVMIVGLWPAGTADLDDAARTEQIAKNLKCPFCSGESIAESPSAVARDLEAIIAEQVASGMTDDEIYDYFAARYGEQVLLDGTPFGWRSLLWVAPLTVLVAGAFAIGGLRRDRRVRQSVTEAAR